jgi:ATP-dependent exoDNAse (exonuclease V) beta subunit
MQRELALDPGQSVLVQAPAGSGKTDLLTRRFLRLLAEVDEPDQIVAITFTNAAAAEMRQRILGELEKAALSLNESSSTALKGHGSDALFTKADVLSAKTRVQAVSFADDPFSMSALANRALAHSRALGWNLVELPSQLRITTIDAFCRELALQQPLLTGLGGGLEIAAQPEELYRRAARSTLRQIDALGKPLTAAIESLLLWRDNGWQEMEDLLIAMLKLRDRWMQDFVLDREQDWQALRERLERPFAAAVHSAMNGIDSLFVQAPAAIEEALRLARFACEQSGLYRELAEIAEFPIQPFSTCEALEEARLAYMNLANFLLTLEGSLRKTVTVRNGFPADRKKEKQRFLELIAALRSIPELEEELAAVRNLPPARYSEEDWQIVRACFTLLRHAAGELQITFAESGAVDFTEVAQIAQRVLRGPDGLPTDAALSIADKIRHLLVDEFQDTSRRQHQLLASLIAAWPEREGRSCFAVGDPMQSIYFFRDADAELFSRVKNVGLEIPSAEGLDNEPLRFDFIPLQANFRTAPQLVQRLNRIFRQVFALDDGSGVTYSSATPAREGSLELPPRFNLHLDFVPQTGPVMSAEAKEQKEAARAVQVAEIVALIQSHQERMEQARARGEKYRIAVLGRARSALLPIAEALRAVQLPFRAIDLEKLRERPEVLDALSLARALLSPLDRVAWLSLLRAPWCGLSLAGLHRLTSDDDAALLARPIAELLEERLQLLDPEDRQAAQRLLDALRGLSSLRAALPTASLGTWLEQVWRRLGGAACVDAAQRANLDLLWSCLDALPNGAQDLLGPALDEALEKLTAQPDPAASSSCGVQLMTIHKSKGLEFEVVIVPELQAKGPTGQRQMLSWLERGLAEPDESGEITEFLIAPLQSKGADRGKAKAFVDRATRARESQEMRRILYVAATRAREDLHFFARPACREDAGGEPHLAEPSNSLLATAWPALEAEVRDHFEAWKAAEAAAKQEFVVQDLAAAAESILIEFPTPIRPTLLRRLPPEAGVSLSNSLAESSPLSSLQEEALRAPSFPHSSAERVGDLEPPSSISGLNGSLYSRHEGGLVSRALGTAVHSLLEELARLRTSLDAASSCAALKHFEARIAAQIRSRGIAPEEACGIAAQAFALVLRAFANPLGAWILAPHPGAASEARWTGTTASGLRTVQADRVFQAGIEPLAERQQCWWIVDYKTALAETPDPAEALFALRPLFAPQLAAYAAVLRGLHGAATPIRAGLFYPRMGLFDWWEA